MICPNGHTSAAEDFCDTCGAKIDAAAQPATVPPLGPQSASPVASPTDQTCPHCQTVNPVDALFCEACGYDFTTGALPRGAAPVAPPPETSEPEASPHETSEPKASEHATSEPEAETAVGSGDLGSAELGSDGAAPAAVGTGIPPRVPLEWVAEVWIDPEWYAGQEAEEPMPSPGLPAVVPLVKRSILVGRISVSRNIHPDIDCAADTGVSRRHAQLTTDGSRWFVEDLASSNGTFVGPASGPLPDDPIAVGPRTELDGDDRVYVGAWTRIVVREATDEEREAGGA